MRTTSRNTQTTKTVSQGESRYGTAEPQIELRLPKGTSHRLVSAALHKLAADVELATPERERWIVQTESFYDARGRVYLELADATPAEAERTRVSGAPRGAAQRIAASGRKRPFAWGSSSCHVRRRLRGVWNPKARADPRGPPMTPTGDGRPPIDGFSRHNLTPIDMRCSCD